MKKLTLYLTLLLLTVALILSLGSCKRGSDPTDDPSTDNPDGDGPTSEVTVYVIADSNGSEYSVVFSENSSLGGKWANAFTAALYKKFSLDVKPVKEALAVGDKYILIGETGNPLSTELKTAVTSGKASDGYLWGYAYKNGSFAIYANCQSAYDIALSEIFDNYLIDGALKVSKDLWVVKEKTKATIEAEIKAEEEAKILAQRNKRLEAAKAENDKFTLTDFDNPSPAFQYTWSQNEKYSWVGEPKDITTTEYVDPPVSPTKSEHPRVMLNSDIVTKLKAFLEKDDHDEATEKIIKRFWEQADTEADGIFEDKTGSLGVYRYSEKEITYIHSKGLAYLITGHKAYAFEAIVGAKNMIKSILYTKDVHMDPYHGYGHLVVVISLVYDWCYDVLTDEDKQMFINGIHNYLLCNLEFTYPPTNMNTATSHATGAQFLRHYLTLALAFADERPDWWDFVGGRFYAEYVPMCNYFFEGGYIPQGTGFYGPWKAYNYLSSAWLLKCATGTLGFDADGLEAATRGLLGMLMPNGNYFTIGDRRSSPVGSEVECTWLFLAAAVFNDPTMLTNAKYFSSDYTYFSYSDLRTTTEVLLLIYFSTIDAKVNDDRNKGLDLITFYGDPGNQMTVRNSFTDDAAATLMRIGGINVGDHDSDDAGTFQVYYKGLLACTSGVYLSFGSVHHTYYMQTTLAHNGLLIYNPNLADSEMTYSSSGKVNNLPRYWYTGGQKPVVSTTLDQVMSGNAIVAELIGHESKLTDGKAKYGYMAGDITKAYDSSTVDYVGRRMLTVYTGDANYPMLFFVFDSIESDSADFRKTFLLHTSNEPNINTTNRSATIVNGDGKMVYYNVLGGDKIQAIGGTGYDFWVGNGNDFDGTAASGKQCTDEHIKKDYSEDIWGRIEVSVSGEVRTDMLSVMYVTDKSNTSALTPKAFENNTFALTTIGDVTAVFIKALDRHETSLAFTTDGTGNMSYYVSGMRAGSWKVSVNGQDKGTYTVTEDGGLLTFDATAGNVVITPGDDIAPTGKITYVTGDGTVEENAPTTYTYGQALPITVKATHPTDTFAGWYFDKDCTLPATEIPATSVGSVKLYAKWFMNFIDEDYSNVSIHTNGDKTLTDTGVWYAPNTTGSTFETMTEGGVSFLRWTLGNAAEKNSYIITKTVTGRTYADMAPSDAILSMQVDLKKPEGKDILEFSFRLNSPGGTYGRHYLFHVTKDGSIYFGQASSGEKIGELKTDGSITSMRMVFDFINAKIYFYSESGEVIYTFDAVVPEVALNADKSLTPSSTNAWREHLTGYYFYFEEHCPLSDAGRAIDICRIKVEQGNIFE